MNRKTIFIVMAVLFSGFTTGCYHPAGKKTGEKQGAAKTTKEKAFINEEKLKKIWVSSPELQIPESVLYDSLRNIIYVSNVNGKPVDKDGNGFISLLDPAGNLVEKEWVKGLNAPKGLAIFKDKLFVSDIQSLVEISIPEKKIIRRYTDTLSKFLNDVAIDSHGNVYVSDMGGSAIYRLSNGVFKKWVYDKRVQSPNGLFVGKNRLLVGLKDRIVSIDLMSRKIDDYILHTGSIDGLESDGHGGYLISDWAGHVHLVRPGGEKILLLDTTPIHMQAADIDFVISSGMLLVPTFNNNRIVAYRYSF